MIILEKLQTSALILVLAIFFAPASSGDAYSDQQLTSNFELLT